MSKFESMVWGPLAVMASVVFIAWLCLNVYMLAKGS